MSNNEILEKPVEAENDTDNKSFTDLVEIQYFNKENSKFYVTETGFVGLNAFMPPVQKDDLDENKTTEPVWQDLGRVYFHRAFPFDLPDKFISVQDRDSKEYGIIKDIANLDDESRKNALIALDRKYFTPNITKIISVKERFGYSYWVVVTDKGRMNFTLQDTFRSIARISDSRLVISDIDGNRYNILNTDSLDSSSYRKIELYI